MMIIVLSCMSEGAFDMHTLIRAVSKMYVQDVCKGHEPDQGLFVG